MSSREPDAIERLRAVDEALARRGASVESRERVAEELRRRALEQPLQRRLRWWPMVAFAAGAVLMGLVTLSMQRERGATSVASGELVSSHERALEAPAEPPQTLEVPVESPLESDACDPLPISRRELELGDCVRFDGVRISALLPTQLERVGPDLVELSTGEALFEVAPRFDHALHVRASQIDIEVVGTRFVVRELDGAGWVSMLEGEVQVQRANEASARLVAGQRIDWGQASEGDDASEAATEHASRAGAHTGEAARSKADASEAAGRSGSSSRDRGSSGEAEARAAERLAAALEEVAALRKVGDYAGAVTLLRELDPRGLSSRARELVSFEIGTLLERQLGDREGACAHWLDHQRRFPAGRYDGIVERGLAGLDCADVE